MRGGFHLKKEKLTIVTIKITSYKKNCANDLCGLKDLSCTYIDLNCYPFHISLKVMTVAAMTVQLRSRTLSGT